MNIQTARESSTLTIFLDGRLDTTTAPSLLDVLNRELDKEVQTLILDFKKVDYMSSAGIRVILSADKTMSDRGVLKLVHVNDEIRDIFDMTAMSDFLTIE